jgi:hypothetical protein
MLAARAGWWVLCFLLCCERCGDRLSLRCTNRFLKPPNIILLTSTWNKMIILYIAVAVIAVIIVVVLIVQYKRRMARVRLHEVSRWPVTSRSVTVVRCRECYRHW